MRWHAAGLAQATVAFVAAGSLAVSGCAANRPAPRSASPRPIAVASSKAPGAPPAEPETPAGAAAFVRAYFAALNWVYESLQISAAKNYSLSQCGACNSFERFIEQEVIAKRLHFSGGTYQLLSVTPDPEGVGNLEPVDVTFDFPAQNLIDSRGQIVNSQAAQSDVLVNVELAWVQDRWYVVRVTRPTG